MSKNLHINYRKTLNEKGVSNMNESGSKKNLIIGTLKIFQDYTDINHQLKQQEIIELLDKNFGLKCNRKTLKSNIQSLEEMGYEIKNESGWFLAERDFEDVEIKMLIDSVLFSKSLSEKQAKILIEKLKGLSNKYFETKVKHVHNLPEMQHTDNKTVLYNREAIDEAIDRNMKISFIYNSYGTDKKLHAKREKPYVVNPYYIVANSGKYYLICNHDAYDNIAHYRLDRITKVEILNERARPKSEIQEIKNGLNLPKHMAEHFYMFSGDTGRIKLKVKRGIFGEVIDSFGKDFTIISEEEDDINISLISNYQAMVFWAIQYGEYVEVIEPNDLREKNKKKY